MKIYDLDKKIIENKVVISVKYIFANEVNYLWYEFDRKYEKYLCLDRYDGFLIGLILLGMKSGQDVYINGALSEKLYYHITNSVIGLIKIIIPELKLIRIYPERLINTNYDNDKVGCGFSGGIDSFKCIQDHFFNPNIPKNYKIDYLVFNNCGSHGRGTRGRRLFNSRYELVKNTAEKIGLPIIKIDSNISDIIGIKFEKINAFMNLSSILILQNLFSKYYYSSAVQYKDCSIKNAKNMAQADPFLLHLFSNENMDIISTGCQYSRIEKTDSLSDLSIVYNNLNVCVKKTNDGKNCSSCWKCNKTLLTLELLGKINNFTEVFNLKKYYLQRNKYIKEYLLKNLNDSTNLELFILLKKSDLWSKNKNYFLDINRKNIFKKIINKLH